MILNNIVTYEGKGTKKIHYAWFILLSLALIQFGDMGIFANSAGVFVQPVCDDLGFSRGGFSFYFSIVCIVMTLMMPIAERVMNTYNLRFVIPAVIILECIAFGTMSLHNSLIGWYISGALLGIGNAFLTYQLIPFVLNNWFKVKYGTALGIASCCSTLGGAIFAPIAGQIIAAYGWRTAYIALATIAFVITFPGAILVLRARPSEIGLQPYGADQVAEETGVNNNDGEAKGFTFAQAVRTPYFYLCILFTIALTFACNFINQFTAFAYTLGFPVAKGAMITSMVLISGVVGDLITGVLNDRFGPGVSISFSLIWAMVGIILLVNGRIAESLVVIGAFCFGLGFALLNTAPPLLTMTVLGRKELSRIYSYIASSLTLSSAVAQSFYGFVYDLAGSYYWGLIVGLCCFAVALVTCVIGVAASIKLWV